MASFAAFGIDVVGNPSIGTNSTAGAEAQGTMTLQGGSQPFADDAIVEFITQDETADGELDSGSSFIGINVYASEADFQAGNVQYTYEPMNPGQSANIQSDLSGLGDTYVRFNANVLVSSDPGAPQLTQLFVAPGTDANDNIGQLELDRTVDIDMDGDGQIVGSPEDGNNKFYCGMPGTVFVCFAENTLITTRFGERAVEKINVGDTVLTRDNGLQPIRWIGSRKLAVLPGQDLRPVLIRAGALGENIPLRDLIVSPNHRILVSGAYASVFFGETEVLAAAKYLTHLPGISRPARRTITYWHILFDQHEVVLANGGWSESFHPGHVGVQTLDNAQRDEIFGLFPELQTDAASAPPTARRTLLRHEARLISS